MTEVGGPAASDGPRSSRRTVGARTGGRSKRVVAAVLRAATEAIAQGGYVALRVEDVAHKAGVNKTTVYRRWPTKNDLVAAAIHASAGHHEPLPDTGSVREDLLAMLARAVAFARSAEGRAVTRLINLEGGDPDVERLTRTLREGIFAQRAEVILRGQRRGELPEAVDARLVLDAIFLPVMSRVLRYGEDVDAVTSAAFVDLALAGAKQGGGSLHEAC
jgi:AcrR family transcriptional regulator